MEEQVRLEKEIAEVEGQIEDLYKIRDSKMEQYKETFKKSA